MRHDVLEPPGYRHEALFYRGDDEFLAGTVPTVRDAVAAGAAVLVAVPKARGMVLREALGDDEAAASFADMEELGRNPGRIIPAWREFVARHAGGDARPLGIGEPIWPERNAHELVECERHETLLNLAFGATPAWTLLCPYDAERLTPEVLDGARRNHPHVCEAGERARSEAYHRAIPGDDALPAPAGQVAELAFGDDELGSVREFLARRAEAAGIAGERLSDLVLAVDELATNSLRYARGRGTLRAWQENGTLLCEVADGGHIADPLAGRELAPPDQLGGRGLYLVNQLCDLVQLRSSPEGSTVRVHMRVAP
jgi:anti-sigma regulatory factor (Ser/Thr protein kinase)